MSGQPIERKILECIKKCGRGKLVFSSDFVRFGEQKTVNKVLERMAKEGTILRISRGVYYYPKIDKKLGLGVLYPTQLAMLLTFAFKSLGKDNVTDEILAHTKELLAKDKSQGVKQDYKLMPAWVSSIIKSLYEE